jgi:hypothetical protein
MKAFSAFCLGFVLCFLVHLNSASQVTANIDPTSFRSDALPSDFASFSVEVGCAPKYFVSSRTKLPRVSYVNLLSFLRNVSSGWNADVLNNTAGPNVRIGGNSADESYFVGSSMPPFHLPPGYSNAITDDEVASYKTVLDWHGSLVIDVSLRNATSAANALAYAEAALQAVPSPSIQAFEIGNEPDLFAENGIRPSNFTFEDYESQFQLYVDTFTKRAQVPMPSIQGATFCCRRKDFDGGLDGYIRRFTARNSHVLRSVSYHHYPLNVCGAGKNVTIEQLLSLEAAESVSFIQGFAKVAKDAGVPFYIGEGNSVACGGENGVSDTYASTLWSVDTMMVAAVSGALRWNFHGCPSAPYTPIALDESKSDVAQARPLYYGMWAFTDAAIGGARIVDLQVLDGNESSKIRLWATLSDSYRPRSGAPKSCTRLVLVAIHKGLDTSEGPTRIHARIIRNTSIFADQIFVVREMKTKSNEASAVDGIYFGNMTFDGSTDGLPSGKLAVEVKAVGSDGSVEFDLDPLTIKLAEIIVC